MPKVQDGAIKKRQPAKPKQPKDPKDVVPKPKAPRAKPVPKPKPIPKPVWTRVPTSLTQSTADERIRIREFALRFASVLDVAKSCLEELEELETERVVGGNRWSDDEEDDEELVGWVSENCVKALVIALLTIIAESQKVNEVERAIKEALKEVRSSGSNLSKIWTALCSLRDTLDGSQSSFTFPDPLPPPMSVTFRSTRSAFGTEATVYVATSAQLVPVVAALVDRAIETQAVRDEFEKGTAREKELVKDAREAIAKENAKWKEARAVSDENADKDKDKDKDKAKGKAKDVPKEERDRHKQIIQDLENALRVMQYECSLRFSELGRDHEGRIYYALTPGPVERDAAAQLLAGGDGRIKFTKRRGPIGVDERKEMQKWSWFVGVWGRKPDGALVAKSEEDEEEDDKEKMVDDVDKDVDEWWGFWDPAEISKVAEWIAMINNLGAKENDQDTAKTDKDPLDKDHVVPSENSTVRESTVESAEPVPIPFVHSNHLLISSGLSDSRPPSPLSDISAPEQPAPPSIVEPAGRHMYLYESL